MSVQWDNPCNKIYRRHNGGISPPAFQRSMHVTPDFVRRIGLETELHGHTGCVNCLEWNHDGSLLASGSDDFQVILWDPFRRKVRTKISTGHTGNIFTVKFLPDSNNNVLVSGAADCKIRVHDVNVVDTAQVYTCHVGRVKRIVTAPHTPCMFWSAGEDGTVMQFDLRLPDTSQPFNPKNVLINLNAHIGVTAEAKCLSINPARPELLAVGANDPYVRVYDRRMLSVTSIKFPADTAARLPWVTPQFDKDLMEGEDYSMPQGCIQYYIAGHLPQKQEDYRKKYRTLASTYVTFSPDGNELLVNLGGEQIYLFDVNSKSRPTKFDGLTGGRITQHSGQREFGDLTEMAASKGSNGFHHSANGTNGHTNGVSQIIVDRHKDKKRSRYVGKPLHPAVEVIKQRANLVFEKQDYTQAILLYNQAIAMAPSSPVLYGNRAAAFMKRNWDGDIYAALRDCHSAISLDPDHLKAHFRLAKCLFELCWRAEALECLTVFKHKFPEYAKSQACQLLDKDIRAAIYSHHTESEEKLDPKPSTYEAAAAAARKKQEAEISEQERAWRADAGDYQRRFCGHCNTTTDIKEANFFGANGQYIVAGSDDGSFFVWDKSTTNIVRVLRGDDSIVNCLQPHPSYCMLATSGIDPVVRLWAPRAEDGVKNERVVDNSHDAAAANQKRMNADPLEVMLMNMGYNRFASVLDAEDEGEAGEGPRETPCRTS